MSSPLVSVICLCYNHARYVVEAMQSVIGQTYPAVELIVVDDASTDNSVEVIKRFVKGKEQIKFISLEQNVGNCAAFNKGLELSSGAYIIDLAADDVLFPTRIEEGVKAFDRVQDDFGVQFSDAQLIDDVGNLIGFHSDKYPHDNIPQGDIYRELIARYFILSPTMLIKRKVLELLNGYDEQLAYEDFDFWIRSSRHFKYLYIPKPLVKRRVLNDAMNSKQFVRGSGQLRSTFKVCRKINELNETPEEKQALINRIRYEIKVSLKLFDFSLTADYFRLLKDIKG
ncbi:MAG: glycosyltransferase [Cyclobacteriaceae bacterium]|nr:glycosyltransferase [Cyclobacteriaceae bacterium]